MIDASLDEIRFFVAREGGAEDGPLTDDEARDALRAGHLSRDARLRLAGTSLGAPARAWAILAGRSLEAPPAPPERASASTVPAALVDAPAAAIDLLLVSIAEGRLTFGPMTIGQLRRAYTEGRHLEALAAIAGTDDWFTVSSLLAAGTARAISAVDGAERATGAGSKPSVRCPTCLERVPDADVCAACDEPMAMTQGASTARPGSIPEAPEGASWLALHWRPVLTVGAIAALVCTGITLRHLAPDRFSTPRASTRAATVAPACPTTCWSGETCQMGACTWMAPNDVQRLRAEPVLSRPFTLPKDASDALLLDNERFAVSTLAGAELRNARTGEVLTLASEAPQLRALHRVGDAVYAVAPQRIFVIDAATTRLIKTIELGATVGDVRVGAAGRRALVSLPGAHAVAILATEYHAEIDRIHFGDDAVGPVATDDSGKRALTTTGVVPLPGFRDPTGGAVYAFDPSRLASDQDRVRASLVGNPVGITMTPDGERGFVALRAKDALVPLAWLPSGAVRQEPAIETCNEPEQIALVRRDRRLLVRCNGGRAIEAFDLATGKLLKHVPFSARATDMAVSPDGKQAIVALPGEGAGWIGLVDLQTWDTKLIALGAEGTRVRLSPDGTAALVLSDIAKVAWVLR
jgi:DNA-binding beta-propeller fold protein YncE